MCLITVNYTNDEGKHLFKVAEFFEREKVTKELEARGFVVDSFTPLYN